ncbi:MAG: pyridoxal phosphate-dependent aminotransferase [Bacteroidales bacterium]|nr:pyridoxal phosphate-dependent aminotransferase [Bacteroidales bacterium]
MNFDDKIIRRGSNCYKWDIPEDTDVIPMWIADMDFQTAPPIVEALRRRVDHGVFGYTKVPKEYFEAVCQWFGARHGWHIEPKEIIYTSGVVPAISAIIKAVTMPGDKVLVASPVYNCFYSSIRNNGCQVAASNMKPDGNGRYSIDFADLEAQCRDPKTRVFLLCNPHNPTSRVWTRDELTRMARICKDNDVFVISDEIHCEIMMPGFQYIPFGSLDEADLGNYAVCTSPSKAFNIAGLQIANIVCPCTKTRRKIDRAININEVCDVNPFGVAALIAAYTNPDCKKWLDELNDYIYGNYQAARDLIAQNIPSATVTPLEGTYLMWVNFGKLVPNAHTMEETLVNEAKVWINPGTLYGDNGEHCMRINLATQRARVIEGVERVCRYFKG